MYNGGRDGVYNYTEREVGEIDSMERQGKEERGEGKGGMQGWEERGREEKKERESGKRGG